MINLNVYITISSTFYNRNIIFCLLLLTVGAISIGFMLMVTMIYPQKDNSINSLCGLCFIFAPVIGVLTSIIALAVEWNLAKEELLFVRVLISYVITFISCLMQTIAVCFLIGTTKTNDSAYQGLIRREFW